MSSIGVSVSVTGVIAVALVSGNAFTGILLVFNNLALNPLLNFTLGPISLVFVLLFAFHVFGLLAVLKLGLVAALVNSGRGFSASFGFAKILSTLRIISIGSSSTALRDKAFKIDDNVVEHEAGSSSSAYKR